MKLVSLVSSGIDSPVAMYLLSKYVDEMILVHADNRPYTNDAEIDNFRRLASHLKTIVSCKTTAFLIPHGPALARYKKERQHRFTCVFCKRMMVRYAEHIAYLKHADALVMGDSLGQVASQTLPNLVVVDQAVSIPILRPLIGYDKNDVITIAKQIGTYELSIQKSSGCQAVPSQPATQTKLNQILAEEAELPIQHLVDDAIKNVMEV